VPLPVKKTKSAALICLKGESAKSFLKEENFFSTFPENAMFKVAPALFER
jgi:hypothetical protein